MGLWIAYFGTGARNYGAFREMDRGYGFAVRRARSAVRLSSAAVRRLSNWTTSSNRTRCRAVPSLMFPQAALVMVHEADEGNSQADQHARQNNGEQIPQDIDPHLSFRVGVNEVHAAE